jgi:choline dehydrogenase-like flavoprotein
VPSGPPIWGKRPGCVALRICWPITQPEGFEVFLGAQILSRHDLRNLMPLAFSSKLGHALTPWRMDDFDYIVVGAGSAGSVLASRLTEDGRSRALLLEFGGSDRSVLIQMPAALSISMNMTKYDWGFATEPEPHLGGRRLATPRGKVLGGSSSINGTVSIRGNPLDFDGWEKQGAEGWGYRHVLPYFRRSDAHEGSDPQSSNSDGPLHNIRHRVRHLEAGEEKLLGDRLMATFRVGSREMRSASGNRPPGEPPLWNLPVPG